MQRSIHRMLIISIHAPTRGATKVDLLIWGLFKNFNPRSHKGSDYIFSVFLPHHIYFNPRSHKGSDKEPPEECPKSLYFNPRSHKGSDSNKTHLLNDRIISIHAPTRGATTVEHFVKLSYKFQSTLPQGERHWSRYLSNGDVDFNPRSHKGSDRIISVLVFRSENFNPRSHKGSDIVYSSNGGSAYISIHAPTRGATYARRSVSYGDIYFNPRSHKGSDPMSLCACLLKTISIHAPTRGATKQYVNIQRDEIISIHAPTRGATIP